MPVQVATGDKFRDNCIRLLHKALVGSSQCSEEEDQRLAEVARHVEQCMYRDCNFQVNKHYKDIARSKIWNLKDSKNPELRENVISGNIGAEEFAKMDSEAMASKERKRQNSIIRKNSLANSIAIVDLKPIPMDDPDPNERKVTFSDRAGNRIWSGSDMDTST
ncbi:transcription elongation factor S-ii [Gigaspora margarita]|uniref:Transcription elongation factor S-ii n=1 Tax=Gigaspora margarita TaxID=4874 RepID=A0A8H4EK73_GIGMA|nr:transcription elongation factor S-ii [Gigaspora margarita]